jgi:O-antigen ligase
MLLVCFVALTYLTLLFGGVQPHNYLLALMWLYLAAVCFLAIRVLKGHAVSGAAAIALILGAVVSISDQPLGLGLLAFAAVLSMNKADVSFLTFFKLTIVLGVFEAVLGLYQYFVQPGWILGYMNTLRMPSGTFVNRNHYAGFLEMVIPMALSLSYLARRRINHGQTWSYITLAAFLGIGLVFSLSRSAILCFFLTLLMLAIVHRQQAASPRRLAATLFFLVAAGAVWIGTDAIFERYAILLEPETLVMRGRMEIYRNTLELIKANPLGIGAGQYADVFRQFQTFDPGMLFDHAHNDVLEITAEWGLPVGLVIWTLVGTNVARGVSRLLTTDNPVSKTILLGSLGGVFSIFLHSFTDFNLQIPANCLLFFILLGMLHKTNWQRPSHPALV